MKTKIITDSISDITSDIAAVYDIEVLPIEISLGGDFVKADKLDVIDTVNWMEKNKKPPEFRGISAETFEETFEKYIKEGMDIVYISSGSTTISNYDRACHVSTRYPNGNVHVIDSRHVSGNTALMTLMAAGMAKDGESANAIVIRLERSFEKFRNYGLAESLDFFKYSGRCPKIVAAGVGLINAKFTFLMQADRDFEVHMVGTSMKKALANHFAEVFKNLRSIDTKMVVLLHTISDSDQTYFSELYKRVADLNYFEEIVVITGGHYSTSLIGRGGVGIGYKLK